MALAAFRLAPTRLSGPLGANSRQRNDRPCEPYAHDTASRNRPCGLYKPQHGASLHALALLAGLDAIYCSSRDREYKAQGSNSQPHDPMLHWCVCLRCIGGSQRRHSSTSTTLKRRDVRFRASEVSAKVLNSSEDAHAKSMSMFETDEHLRALMFVRSAL